MQHRQPAGAAASSKLYLPYISTCLPYISLISPLYLPYISLSAEAVGTPTQTLTLALTLTLTLTLTGESRRLDGRRPP